MNPIERALTIGQDIMTAVIAAGEAGIPSGHLYAFMCDKVTYDEYKAALHVVKRAGLVTEDAYLLKVTDLVNPALRG